MSPLLNVCKFFGKRRKKHQRVQKANMPTSFRNFEFFLNIFGSVRKSPEVFGKNRKCRKVQKATFEHFSIFSNFQKSWGVFGCLRKSLEVFGKTEKCRKILKTIFRHFLKNFRRFSEIFGSVWKWSEDFGNPRKMFECIQRFMNFF